MDTSNNYCVPDCAMQHNVLQVTSSLSYFNFYAVYLKLNFDTFFLLDPLRKKYPLTQGLKNLSFPEV